MSLATAYITGLGVCLPNEPVTNETIEDVLGNVNRFSRVVRRRVLMNNGIKSRHYAIDPKTGLQTHTNAQMTADAIRKMCSDAGISPEEIECLVCGTSSADQVIPNHGSMVHAELHCPPCEVTATSGVCCAGMSSLKYAYMNVVSNIVTNAVATGSELASPALRSQHFSAELAMKEADIDERPIIAFENDFLRWMLSDAAGAMLVTNQPRKDERSLRIDWIDLVSYASESDTCMYFGMKKRTDGSTGFWRSVSDMDELCRDGYLNLAQDVNILAERLPALMSKAIRRSIDRHDIHADQIDWILPHYSSDFFRQPLYDRLVELGFEMPWEKWFSNLQTKGNTGSASIYVILEELVSSGKIRPGQRILCVVPESARMTFSLMQLTVV